MATSLLIYVVQTCNPLAAVFVDIELAVYFDLCLQTDPQSVYNRIQSTARSPVVVGPCTRPTLHGNQHDIILLSGLIQPTIML